MHACSLQAGSSKGPIGAYALLQASLSVLALRWPSLSNILPHLNAELWNSSAFFDALQSPDLLRFLQEAASNMSTRQSIPVAPVSPVGPVPPVGPVSPVAPVDPIIPVYPVAPVRPVPPVGPVNPSWPVGPVLPVAPAQWKGVSCYSLSQAICHRALAGRQAVRAHSLQRHRLQLFAVT